MGHDATELHEDLLLELRVALQSNNMTDEIEKIFTKELHNLTSTASSNEVLISLQRINLILGVLDIHFRAFLVNELRFQLTRLGHMNPKWPSIVSEKVIVAIRSYMIFNYVSSLPEGILLDIFGWLPIKNFQSLLYVSKEWNVVARNETHWKRFYHTKFPIRNSLESSIISFFPAYRYRLINPLLNDCVEIAWRGKFRLEGLDVYRGLAWWNAKIVDRHVAQNKYKVHYDGWEAKWDEWVDRGRLRWPFNPKTSCDGASSMIKRDDVVEVWCQGNLVPGAWLEARVKRIRGTRLQLDKIQINELPLWVNQHQVRVLERSFDPSENDRTVDEVLDGDLQFPADHVIQDSAINCGIL